MSANLLTFDPTKKACAKCKELKPATLEYFASDRSLKSGLKAHCKACENKYRRQRYATGSIIRQHDPIAHRINVFQRRLSLALNGGTAVDPIVQTNAFLRNLIAIQPYCNWTGCKHKFVCGTMGNSDQNTSPQLDKIVPSLGYVSGNVQLLCHIHNRTKSNMEMEDCVEVYRQQYAALRTMGLAPNIDDGSITLSNIDAILHPVQEAAA